MKQINIQLINNNIALILITILISNLSYSQTTFVESQNIPSTFPTAAELVDLDGDNDLDLIRTLDRATGLNNLNANEIWLNDGSGNFTLHQTFGNSESRDLAVGDLDGDSDIDIFIANATFFIGQSSISSNKVWLNDGLGNFSTNGQSLGVRRSIGVSLADLDGDNDLDAFVANSGDTDNPNTVWINNGSGQFTDSNQLLGSFETQDVASIDIDNDNDIDIITANCCNDTNNANVVWINNGSGQFTNNQEIGDFSSEKISASDIDGDNDLDIVFSNTFEDSKIYLNDGSGNFSFHTNIASFPVAQAKTIKFSDFDNDGDNDLIVTIFSDLYENRILLNDGIGNFTEDFLFSISNTRDVAIGDIDNDGDKDIFMLNINNQDSEFWINQKILSVSKNIKPLLNIYPNPADNFIIIQSTELNSKFEIFDLLGNRVNNGILEKKINTRDLNAGVYFLRIGSTIKRFIKK